jgi:hypothetical protein
MKIFTAYPVLSFLIFMSFGFGQSTAPDSRFALFVEVPSTKIDPSHADYARDKIAAELTKLNFPIITHEAVINAVAQISDPNHVSAHKSLSENNMQSLAQLLNADYFICFTLNDFRSESKDLPRFDRKIFTHSLSANFRVVSSSTAASSFGESLTAIKKIPITSNIQIEVSKIGLINELIDDVCEQLSKYIFKRQSITKSQASPTDSSLYQRNKAASPTAPSNLAGENGKVMIQISGKIQGIAWPEIKKNENGEVILSGVTHKFEATDAEVEIDGIFVGNCSSENSLPVSPGIRRLRVSRGGYVAVEKTINAYDGLKLSIQLQPTEQETREWREQLSFLQQIKIGEKLTEAEVLKAKGMYEFLKNSKFEVPSNVTYKSLY